MKQRGKQRSVIVILLLSLVTLGIYYFYWYYANINELDGYFDFSEYETSPKDVKLFLYFYILTTLAVSFIIGYDTGQQFIGVASSSKKMIFLSLISNGIGAILNYKFLRLIDISFEESKLEDINFNLIFGIYIASISASFFSVVSNAPAFILISGILAIVYLVMVQGKINLLWRTI